MGWHVFVGGAWEESYAPSVLVGGEWRQVIKGYVFDAGAWHRFFPDEEPSATTIDGGLAGTVLVGVDRTVFGTVSVAEGVVPGGSVTLYQRPVGTDDTAWVNVGTAPIFNPGSQVGNWSMTATPSLCGASEFKAVYGGNGGVQPSESAIAPVAVTISAPGQPTGGAITDTSLAISWSAVAGATGYQLFLDGGSVASVGSGTTSYTFTGLTPGSTHDLSVVAVSGSCVSAQSPAKQGRTSATEVRDTGSATIQVDSSRSGSYRPDQGWGYIAAKVGQGYYSISGRNYTGVIDYGGAAAMQAKIEAALGVNGVGRFANGTLTGARVYLHKLTGVGSSGSVTASFYRSTAQCDVGGEPDRVGTVVNVATTVSGSGKWYDIGTAHGDAIARGTGGARSVALYNFGSANYLQMGARDLNADSCDMQMDWSWDYVLQPAVGGSWLN